MNRHAMTKLFAAFSCLLPALILAACHADPQAAAGDPPLAGAAIGGDFNLVDKAGKPVRWADFQGKYRIVYFGYTFCPDACPTDVGTTIRGLNLFAKDHAAQAAKVQPLFISIDPARDTPAVVGQFAAAFSPRLIGLTGTQAQVDQAAKAFAVYHTRGKDTPGGYLMDHSRVVYLMGPNGQPIDMLPADKGAPAVAATLAKWVR
ncbi:MAG: SCO family protein [Sphingomonadales bacterium]|nr:SCO family protein [Sphingomonadales bacterium]